MPNQLNTLSRAYDSLSRQIVTPVTLRNLATGQELNTYGIWDTGATGCVISEDAAKNLALIPIGQKETRGISGGRMSNVYYINITLNNNQISLNARVTDCDKLSDDGSIGLLIGMDIITLGDFYISNHHGKTVMTFRVPSLESRDFTREIEELKRYRAIHEVQTKHGNNKCPCKSGKNWNQCHGKIVKAVVDLLHNA